LPAAASRGGEGGGGGWEGLEGGLGFVATRVAPERSDAGAERNVKTFQKENPGVEVNNDQS
jgi:hypothetical protein